MVVVVVVVDIVWYRVVFDLSEGYVGDGIGWGFHASVVSSNGFN